MCVVCCVLCVCCVVWCVCVVCCMMCAVGTQRDVFGPKNGILPKSLKLPQNNFITSLQTKKWQGLVKKRTLYCPKTEMSTDGGTDGGTDMLIAIPFGFLPRGKKYIKFAKMTFQIPPQNGT